LSPLSSPTHKLILSAIKPSADQWHRHLGHPAHDIVLHVIRSNNLSCSGSLSQDHVCDAYLRAKAHQFPYSKSSSQSTAPLELMYSDVWALPLVHLAIRNTMLVLLMISVNLHGSILFGTNLMCYIFSRNFSALWSAS
jgi:hypothetical protein